MHDGRFTATIAVRLLMCAALAGVAACSDAQDSLLSPSRATAIAVGPIASGCAVTEQSSSRRDALSGRAALHAECAEVGRSTRATAGADAVR
jgi:hypothetical protein